MKLIGVFFLGFCLLTSLKKDEAITKAPDISLTDPNGNVIKLSSLKGKLVLVDFWASWCGPCRKENPNVVEAYLKFKDEKFEEGKGFEVFSVSIDRTKDQWVKAIKDDGLIWVNHGWDDKREASKLYNVRFIPSAFLVNGDGEIIAQGDELRGNGLEEVLQSLVKSKKSKK